MALRIIHKKPKLTPSNPLFQESGLLTGSSSEYVHNTVYKAIQGQKPTYISHMFPKSNSEYRTLYMKASSTFLL